jgi:hypothetical protein
MRKIKNSRSDAFLAWAKQRLAAPGYARRSAGAAAGQVIIITVSLSVCQAPSNSIQALQEQFGGMAAQAVSPATPPSTAAIYFLFVLVLSFFLSPCCPSFPSALLVHCTRQRPRWQGAKHRKRSDVEARNNSHPRPNCHHHPALSQWVASRGQTRWRSTIMLLQLRCVFTHSLLKPVPRLLSLESVASLLPFATTTALSIFFFLQSLPAFTGNHVT